jgi:hypothetical protein
VTLAGVDRVQAARSSPRIGRAHDAHDKDERERGNHGVGDKPRALHVPLFYASKTIFFSRSRMMALA